MNRAEAREKVAAELRAHGVKGTVYAYKVQRTDGSTPIVTIVSGGIEAKQFGASMEKKFFLAVTSLVLWPSPESAPTWTTQMAEAQLDEQAELIVTALHMMKEDRDALSIEYTDRSYVNEVVIEGYSYLAETFLVEVNDI